jgi:hypothetical protein
MTICHGSRLQVLIAFQSKPDHIISITEVGKRSLKFLDADIPVVISILKELDVYRGKIDYDDD